MNNLRHNLLTYIGYALDGRFKYDKVSFDFIQLAIAHEPSTLRKEYSLLKKEGLITFRLRYRKPYPILTTKGKLEIKTRLPYKKYDNWDHKWRLVLFDLPQRDRRYRLLLVEELTKLGFASLQRSAYISTHPLLTNIDKLTNHWGIRRHVSLLTVEKIEDEETVPEKWQIKNINEAYKAFLKKTERVQRHARLWPLQAKQLEQSFAEIYEMDPHLPKELLPKDWQGQSAYDRFKEICNSY